MIVPEQVLRDMFHATSLNRTIDDAIRHYLGDSNYTILGKTDWLPDPIRHCYITVQHRHEHYQFVAVISYNDSIILHMV